MNKRIGTIGTVGIGPTLGYAIARKLADYKQVVIQEKEVEEPRGYAFVNNLDELSDQEKQYLDEAKYKVLILGSEEADKVLAKRDELPLRRGAQFDEAQYPDFEKIKISAPPKLEYPAEKKDKTDYSKPHRHLYKEQSNGTWMCQCGLTTP